MTVIISEYVEGSSNNKALELANTGNSSVDLSNYTLEFYFNGSTTIGSTVPLSGLLSAGETLVVADNDAVFAGTADLISNASFYNGDDAIVLRDAGGVVDSIGQIGVDPGTEWGIGDQSTANNTLRRKLHLEIGDTNPNDVYDPAAEWDAYVFNTFDGLGEHQIVPRTFEPSAEEQLLLELLNAARADPAGHMTQMFNTGAANVDGAISFFGTDQATAEAQVAGLAPRAPLAWNMELAASAENHNNLMIQYDEQGHNLPGEPDLLQRVQDTGYDVALIGENVFAFTQDPLYGHAGFYIDWGTETNGIQDPPGHRNTMLDPTLRDVGMAYTANEIGTLTGPFAFSQHIGLEQSPEPMLVGVVTDDLDNDDFYDIGEGLGGITVTADDGTNTYTTTTWASGGYALAVGANASYTVTFSGPGLGDDKVFNVAMGTDNVARNAEAGVLLLTVADLYSDNTLGTLLSSHTSFVDAFGAATAGQAIDITNEATVGNVGAQNVAVNDLTLLGDAPFDGIFTLAAGVEDISLRGTTNADATGNALGNLLSGSDGSNTMIGLGGHDDLAGGGGQDTLIGGEGNDTLRGGLGDDDHQGGLGNDLYIVRDIGDTITEFAGEGTDTIWARVDYTAPANVEKIFANAGSAGLALTGNELDNDIRGLSGTDMLIGGAGNDTFRGKGGTDFYIGETGDDVYYVVDTGTSITEAMGEGHDRVYTTVDFTLDIGQEVETVRAISGAGLTLTGNELSNRIEGSSGADTLNGGAANDVLLGRNGVDSFVFDENWGVDVVRDFHNGTETLDVSAAGIAGMDELVVSQHGGNVRVTHGSDVIILIGENAAGIGAEDFVFADEFLFG